MGQLSPSNIVAHSKKKRLCHNWELPPIYCHTANHRRDYQWVGLKRIKTITRIIGGRPSYDSSTTQRALMPNQTNTNNFQGKKKPKLLKKCRWKSLSCLSPVYSNIGTTTETVARELLNHQGRPYKLLLIFKRLVWWYCARTTEGTDFLPSSLASRGCLGHGSSLAWWAALWRRATSTSFQSISIGTLAL